MKDDQFYFSFTPAGDKNGEEVSLSFTMKDEYNLYDVVQLFKRFAYACGYLSESIESVFGGNNE